MKLFELFAGYGGASFALEKAGIDFETVGYSEIDKYAIQCYEQNHKNKVVAIDVYNKNLKIDGCIGTLGRHNGSVTNIGSFPIVVPNQIKNYGDITQIDEKELPDFDLLTGGFPCQSFSLAGKRLGTNDERGVLFYDIVRIAEHKQPKYIVLENVKGLLSKKYKDFFGDILRELDRIGYDINWKVLNSKHYGIPQNRERVWFVCTRKDLKQLFKFPEPIELKIFLKDILEEEVDEKYYLKEEQIKRLLIGLKNNNTFTKHRMLNEEISRTLLSREYKDPKLIPINKPAHSNNRVYDPKGLSPTLNTMNEGNRQPFIVASRGRNPKNSSDRTIGEPTEQVLEPKLDGTSNCLSTVQKDNWLMENTRIRKLTPVECFRLMGFTNDEIKLEGLSNTQKYKLAGNGWTLSPVDRILSTLKI